MLQSFYQNDVFEMDLNACDRESRDAQALLFVGVLATDRQARCRCFEYSLFTELDC